MQFRKHRIRINFNEEPTFQRLKRTLVHYRLRIPNRLYQLADGDLDSLPSSILGYQLNGSEHQQQSRSPGDGAASSTLSRAPCRAAPEFTSRTCRAIVQPRRVAYFRIARFGLYA